jgi:hypothetical protein
MVVEYMQQKINTQLEARLDNNSYDISRLIELKVPLNLPYPASWSGYQRFDGEVEVNGLLYKYVERKISNDTLYVKCIPNTKKMHLEAAKNDFFKNTNDLAQNDSNKSDNSKSITFKNQQSEYDQHSFEVNACLPVIDQQTCWLPAKFEFTLPAPHVSPEQPPDSHRA